MTTLRSSGRQWRSTSSLQRCQPQITLHGFGSPCKLLTRRRPEKQSTRCRSRSQPRSRAPTRNLGKQLQPLLRQARRILPAPAHRNRQRTQAQLASPSCPLCRLVGIDRFYPSLCGDAGQGIMRVRLRILDLRVRHSPERNCKIRSVPEVAKSKLLTIGKARLFKLRHERLANARSAREIAHVERSKCASTSTHDP